MESIIFLLLAVAFLGFAGEKDKRTFDDFIEKVEAEDAEREALLALEAVPEEQERNVRRRIGENLTDLQILWNAVIEKLAEIDDLPGIIILQDMSDTDIRTHINDPQNEILLQLIDKLDLSNKGLKNLPPEVEKFKNLVKLDLSNNELAYLPAEIGNLDKLEDLNLSDNGLFGFPEEFSRLHNLRILNIHNNMISVLEILPITMSLVKLEALYI